VEALPSVTCSRVTTEGPPARRNKCVATRYSVDLRALDHVFVLARREATEASSILQDASTLVIDGERSPRWRWAAARRHRIRLINITPDDVLTVSLLRGETPVAWRRIGKDGAALAGADAETPASVRIAVGETYDFEYEATPGRGRLWLDVRTAGGKWQAQGEVIVR
jgi:hypothetical protein